MRSHGTAMANSAKNMVKTYQKNMVNLGIYHGFIMICRGFICWDLPRSCSDLSWIDWVYHCIAIIYVSFSWVHPCFIGIYHGFTMALLGLAMFLQWFSYPGFTIVLLSLTVALLLTLTWFYWDVPCSAWFS